MRADPSRCRAAVQPIEERVTDLSRDDHRQPQPGPVSTHGFGVHTISDILRPSSAAAQALGADQQEATIWTVVAGPSGTRSWPEVFGGWTVKVRPTPLVSAPQIIPPGVVILMRAGGSDGLGGAPLLRRRLGR